MKYKIELDKTGSYIEKTDDIIDSLTWEEARKILADSLRYRADLLEKLTPDEYFLWRYKSL